jgi:hypothetical protein
MALSLLISFMMSFSVGGLDTARRIAEMMTINTTTDATTNSAGQNNPSSEAEDKLPIEIQLAEAKVLEEASADKRAGDLAKLLLFAYVLITGAVAASTVWNNRTTGRLRAAENLLNNLQKEKIRTDSARKTEVDTERVRAEAANDLALKTDAVRSEGKENLDKAKAELAKEQTKLAEEQRKTADAQKKAADAQLALKRHVEEVAERQKQRIITQDQGQRMFEILTSGERGAVTVGGLERDAESRNFAAQIATVLHTSGWQVDPLPFGWPSSNIPDGLFVRVRDKNNMPARAHTLLRALEVLGYGDRLVIQNGPIPSLEGLELIVGVKPGMERQN